MNPKRAIPALALAALSLLAAAPAASGAAEPPTAAEVRAATERFLAAQPEAALRPGSGGVAPQGEGALLPENRVVAFYGAPQLTRTIIGRTSPGEAIRRLGKQAAAYEGPSRRPVVAAVDLIGTIATASPGAGGKYRMRQSPEVIDAYLARTRQAGARLMLDIQPGRSSFRAELRALRDVIAEPDVDVALDPEWNVGRRGIPGRTQGSVSARQVNRVAAMIQRIVERNGLPPKLLVVHQFHERSVRNRDRLRHEPDVSTVLNFDGIGSPGAKRAGYVNLAAERVFNGFSLFYSLDAPLMSPAAVLRLEPQPDFLLYQ